MKANHDPSATHESALFDPVFTSEVGRILGKSAETVRAMERSGILPAVRTATGVRIFDRPDVERAAREIGSPGATAFESNVPQDVLNIFPGEEALSSFDHRHQFVASGSYQFPFFEGAGGASEALAGGWRVNAVVTLQSGAPFTVNLGQDRANIGSGPAQRPDQVGDPNLPAGQRSPDQWFNTAAFALPDPFTFGSAGRNSVFAPGLANIDVSIVKGWSVGGQGRLEFRWEIFNLLNRANFDVPNRVFGTPNFGRIFSAQNAREMQFGLRYSF